ncbi:MAG: hypothetical protein HY818_08250 [Acetobacterium woodii]|nr:hypothetical protein [Acetobacterium woodii]
MISSISQSGSASSIWQAYQAKQVSSSETSDTGETSQVDGSMPPPPKGPPPPPSPEASATSDSTDSTTLTSEQEDLISSMLENYDAASLTEEDATNIVTALKDAGITLSSALADEVEDNGFDLKEILDLVPASASMPNGGISQNYMQIRESMGSLSILDDTELSQTTKTSQSLQSLFEQYQDSQDSSSQVVNVLA